MHQVGIHLLQPRQLGLDILQVPQLRHLHTGELRSPGATRRLADAVLAAGLSDLRTGLHFLEDPDDLLPLQETLSDKDLRMPPSPRT